MVDRYSCNHVLMDTIERAALPTQRTGVARRLSPGLLPNQRERKKLETRAALESAALRLFAAQGYERTTIEEIAAAADVAVRTFFRYFQSKQHVLFGEVAHNVAGRLRMALDSQPHRIDPVTAVGAALAALGLEDGEQERQVLARIRLVEQLPELGGTYHLLFQELHEVIADSVAARVGQPRTALYPQLLAAAATGAVKSALTVFQATDGARSLNDLRDEAYHLLTCGLRRPAPR